MTNLYLNGTSKTRASYDLRDLGPVKKPRCNVRCSSYETINEMDVDFAQPSVIAIALACSDTGPLPEREE